MRISPIALGIAAVWIISIVSLFIALSGFQLFETVTVVTSILAGIGMGALARSLNRNTSGAMQIGKMAVGLVGSVVYTLVNVLILVDMWDSDELEQWMIGGLAIFGIWMILDSVYPAINTQKALRTLEMGIGIGFLLLFLGVLTLGTIGTIPPADEPMSRVMLVVQSVGGVVAYFGFPVWLFFLSQQMRHP